MQSRYWLERSLEVFGPGHKQASRIYRRRATAGPFVAKLAVIETCYAELRLCI